MNLFVIAGFLGSGKTSLLLAIAKAVSDSGRKLAIIENEVGDVGVDDIFLAGEGLPVKEIYSGCICCSLRGDLIATLLEIEREFAPDIVILEPSGVASARQVLSALQGYGGEIDRKHVAVIIDAERFSKLEKLNIPIITDGIHAADIIVVNKLDLVSPEELEEVSGKIRSIRPEINIINVSAAQNDNVELLVKEFMAVPDSEKKPDKVLPFMPSRGGLEPVPYAHNFALSNLSHGDVGTVLANIVQGIGHDVINAGCEVIGHIKAVAKTANGGYLMASATSSGQRPHLKGRLPSGQIDELKVALNVIVYGIEKDTIAEIVEIRIARYD